MDVDGSAVMENADGTEKKDMDVPVFKKPALLAAPSLTSNRNSVSAPSKPLAVETTDEEKLKVGDTIQVESADGGKESKSTEIEEGESIDVAKGKKYRAPVKVQSEKMHRVLRSPGPSAAHFPPLKYTEPSWGGNTPDSSYSLEILKNGTIVDTVPLTEKSYYVVGRLPVCDVSLEHPSISRYHAVIQYRSRPEEGESTGGDAGFYVQDLGSTHGTVVNKNKIPPMTYIRLRVGHVLKFGGSTRLFILQGPEYDEEEESELTVTELREQARKKKEELERRMMGEGSDNEEEGEEDKDGESKNQSRPSNEDSGCSWGMAEEVVPEEDDNEENPFSTEFLEDQEAAYLKDPKKALQGFYDREGEELEFEYEDKGRGSWLCRIKLPVDDALGRQLVAEVTHTGKKKEAAIHCCLEACRMLEARGLLRQEAVSRKRKKKNWEDEDYYDSDDDTFLDRTGTVEKKREERMKKAGKIEEHPETFKSLVAKLAEVEKELAETQRKLNVGKGDCAGSSTEDPLDAFMTAVRSKEVMDSVERKKLHLHVADLRKDVQRLHKLIKLTRPTQIPSLSKNISEQDKPKKALPLFGAMKGGNKFKLKTGTIGKLPPKRANLPAELFNMKSVSSAGEEVEEEEEEESADKHEDVGEKTSAAETIDEDEAERHDDATAESLEAAQLNGENDGGKREKKGEDTTRTGDHVPERLRNSMAQSCPESRAEGTAEPAAECSSRKKIKKGVLGPKRPPVQLSGQYPEDDPDYSMWLPPAGQTGDGRTALNDKYGY
ncbi:kanadaptin [Takifugu flavidus]|uniref:kanadaptin n=1 Tax=Takifugu flavidus TaxID=433684 RepID=UPI0025440535|nr:kanadaptin [Takifugu flavidus]